MARFWMAVSLSDRDKHGVHAEPVFTNLVSSVSEMSADHESEVAHITNMSRGRQRHRRCALVATVAFIAFAALSVAVISTVVLFKTGDIEEQQNLQLQTLREILVTLEKISELRCPASRLESAPVVPNAAAKVDSAALSRSSIKNDNNNYQYSTTDSPVQLSTAKTLWKLIEEDSDLYTFKERILSAELKGLLNQEDNYTVYAPTNEAFGELPDYYSDDDATSVTKMHIAKGTIWKRDMTSSKWNEHIVQTLLAKRNIRGNIYWTPSQVITVNGRPVIDFDREGSNGVLHKLSKVMVSAYSRHRGNIGSEIQSHAKASASHFLTLLNDTKLHSIFSRPGRNIFTVFIPTDNAFISLPQRIKTALKTDLQLAAKIVSYHIVPNRTWYTAGLYKGLDLPTLLPEKNLIFDANGGGIPYIVNSHNRTDAKIVVADRTANNGAWHLITEVLLPPDAEFDLS